MALRLRFLGLPEAANSHGQLLAQYDNLQDFAGLTFDEWAIATGVNPPPSRIYFPFFSRSWAAKRSSPRRGHLPSGAAPQPSPMPPIQKCTRVR